MASAKLGFVAGELTGDDGRGLSIAIFHHPEQVVPSGGHVQVSEAEVVEDEDTRLGQLREENSLWIQEALSSLAARGPCGGAAIDASAWDKASPRRLERHTPSCARLA